MEMLSTQHIFYHISRFPLIFKADDYHATMCFSFLMLLGSLAVSWKLLFSNGSAITWQGNWLHSQGKFYDASQKYLHVSDNLSSNMLFSLCEHFHFRNEWSLLAVLTELLFFRQRKTWKAFHPPKGRHCCRHVLLTWCHATWKQDSTMIA